METAVVDVINGREGGGNNPLGCFYDFLQAFPLSRSAAAIPNGAAVGKDAFYGAAVEVCQRILGGGSFSASSEIIAASLPSGSRSGHLKCGLLEFRVWDPLY